MDEIKQVPMESGVETKVTTKRVENEDGSSLETRVEESTTIGAIPLATSDSIWTLNFLLISPLYLSLLLEY